MKIKSLLGEKFGRMVVIGEPEQGLHKRVIARCDCGNELLVQAGHLRSGHTSSCGCAKRERFTKFGIAAKSLYTMHTCMVNRCTNPNHDTYKYYGGRGIQVCAEWSGGRGSWHFAEWSIANGYQAGLQIDRIDSNGDYSPDNCRFVTRRENANNCRDTVFIDFNGVSMPTSYAAERAGINYKTLKTRLHRGWSADRALTHPVRKLRQADGSRAQ